MANITVNSGFGFDIRDFDFSEILHAVSYSRSSTSFVARYALGKEEFHGTNFTYDGTGTPIGGTVTSYAVWHQTTRAFLVNGFSVAMTSIVAAARTSSTSDDLKVIAGALAGADLFNGGNDADYARLYAGNDTAAGNGGNDSIFGGDGNDTVAGGDGSDTLYGEAGIDKLEGGSGNDLLNGGAGADTLNGGTGTDTVSYSGATAGVTAKLAGAAANTGDAKGDVYISIERLTGSSHADKLYGNGSANLLTGGSGDDLLHGGAGADTLNGGTGTDTASYSDATAGVTAKLADAAANTGDAKGDVYISIERLTGSSHADRLYGNGSANLLTGGSGDDLLHGGAGADTLNGGTGTDTASYSGATAGVTAKLADAAANTGDAKGDVYISIERLTGSSHADKLYGNGSANLLTGGSGDDLLNGGSGNDTLYGALGADDLTGGAGADIFLFKALTDTTVALAGRDSIFDFSLTGNDRIDLSAIDANTSASGNQAFWYLGTSVFTGHAGELRYIKQASDTYVYGDVNGDKKVDFAIHLDDALSFEKGDFIL